MKKYLKINKTYYSLKDYTKTIKVFQETNAFGFKFLIFRLYKNCVCVSILQIRLRDMLLSNVKSRFLKEGNMFELICFALNYLKTNYHYTQKVWLEVYINNIPAVSLYKKLGFNISEKMWEGTEFAHYVMEKNLN